MAHQVEVTEEHYVFKPSLKTKLYAILGIGALLLVLGLFLSKDPAEAEGAEHGGGHGGHSATVEATHMVASAEEHAAASEGHHEAGAEHHETKYWIKRLYTTLWMNNVYFAGLGIIGLFFVAVQFAAQAGWSVGVKRIALAMGTWMPIAGLLMLALWFVTKHDIFHWTHPYLYQTGGAEFDAIINKKAPFFFWPLKGGTFPVFFIGRMVLFFGLWYWFFNRIRQNMIAEDLEGGTSWWYKSRGLSAWFLVFFGASSSIAAWDWVMSIDTHWFSTMFGWYVFASWWVTGLAVITLIAAHLKSAGYLKIVNANHLHDLGKFVFAFSIFWTYIWFSQFLLIYYAHIPEETVYFVERMRNSPYSWIFYLNIIVNFVLPFLLFMTRDAKRHLSTLKLVCPIVIVGHWFDFFNMVTPGVMKHSGGVGFVEIGVFMIFAAVFLLVVLNSLTKLPLFGKNDPMLQESLHHHI